MEEQLQATRARLDQVQEEAATSAATVAHLTGQLASVRAQGLVDVSTAHDPALHASCLSTPHHDLNRRAGGSCGCCRGYRGAADRGAA